MKGLFLGAALSIGAVSASAQGLDTMQLAGDLGTVLASEEFCELSFNQDAISAWIDEKVDPSDLGFASMLSTMIDGTKFGFSGMGESQKTAHCRAVGRSAKHYGFIE